MQRYFLAKTDPDTYSITDLKKEAETNWDGIHNPQAVGVIKSWKPGDLVLVYHSGGETRLMGLMEVISKPVPDPNDRRGTSWYARVRFIREFSEKEQITLRDIKASGLFQDFVLVRQGRLSTMECPKDFIDWLKVNGVKV